MATLWRLLTAIGQGLAPALRYWSANIGKRRTATGKGALICVGVLAICCACGATPRSSARLTPGPTDTPPPTNTPAPTNTPRPTATPTPLPSQAEVERPSNMRRAPQIEAGNIQGQLCPGDAVEVLDGVQIADAVWYRVRVTVQSSASCDVAQRLPLGTEGWVSGTLLSNPSREVAVRDATPVPVPTAAPTAVPTRAPAAPPAARRCDPSYPDLCIPPGAADLDCPDIPQKNFRVVGSDPHRFDRDRDGIGCEG